MTTNDEMTNDPMTLIPVENAVEKQPNGAPEAVVDEIEYHKSQHEYPEETDGKF